MYPPSAYVLFNGSEFWVCQDTSSPDVADAIRIDEALAVDYIHGDVEQVSGFWPVLSDFFPVEEAIR